MAEESDSEKTEEPSGRRLSQAREEGQVPQSRELSTFLVVMSGVLTLWLAGGWFAERMLTLARNGFRFEREHAFDPVYMLKDLMELFSEALLTVAPLFGVLLVAAVAAPILMGGLVFSPKVLEMKLSRLNPLTGFGRIFSVHGLMEAVKSLLKSTLIGLIGAWVVWTQHEHIFALMTEPLENSLPDFAGMLIFSAVLITSGLVLLVALDVPFQKWQYMKNLRMTKDEVKRENKEMEGDPMIKGRIRSMQREMARRRMMQQVPQADVVVTNPTHFSVALKYDADKMGAPVVIAKGRGEVALKIRELAREHEVPLLEAPPLARALYAHCELEQAIPAALYTAVAEVMAYVYQLNHWMEHGGLPPIEPTELAVPEGMDPGSPDE